MLFISSSFEKVEELVLPLKVGSAQKNKINQEYKFKMKREEQEEGKNEIK